MNYHHSTYRCRPNSGSGAELPHNGGDAETLRLRSGQAPGLLSPSLLPTPNSLLPTLFLFLALFLSVNVAVQAQVVYLPVRHPVYDYLDRIEARYGLGMLQFMRPLPRTDIARTLDSLGRGPFQLTPYDKAQLAFYREEFAEELRRLHVADTAVVLPVGERWDLVRVRSDTPAKNFIVADFVGAGGYERRQDADPNRLISTSNGIMAYGYVSSFLGASLRWYDNNRNGMRYDVKAARTQEQGMVRHPGGSATSHDFEIVEAQTFYSNPWLVAGVQKQDIWQGSGRFGSIIFSDKVPSVPMVSFQIRITDWLSFDYFHAWLFADSLDFERTYYPPGGPGAKFQITKYMASHHLTARVRPNLQLAFGESIIYSGSDVNVLFLMPFISFRAADRWALANVGNSQFFADARWTPFKHLTIYGTGYIDELDASKVFSSDENGFDYQVAYTVGGIVTDAYWNLVRLPSETRLEFSRVYPYAYSNPNPTQQYTSHQVILGHWIGANADIVSLDHTVHPFRGWDVTAGFWHGRFGTGVPFKLVEPRGPQPGFLSYAEYSMTTVSGSVRWTPLHDLWVKASASYRSVERFDPNATVPYPGGLSAGLSVAFGLW